jgi:hypothetical protein
MSDSTEYTRDPTAVGVITSIPNEGASSVKRELRKTVFNHVRAPKKKPPNMTPAQLQAEQESRVEQGVADDYDDAYEQLAVPDEAAINEQLSTYYTILTEYDPVVGAQTCLIYIAPTVARKRLGRHETLWYGSFEVAKETDDGWEALCFSTLNPVADYNTGDRHTTNSDDDVWLPTYGVPAVWHTYDHPPDDALHLARTSTPASSDTTDDQPDTNEADNAADALSCSRGRPEDADIYIHSPRSYDHGTQLIFECPKAAADDVKNIPTPPAYQSYSPKHAHWRFDADALLLAIDTLTAAGWTVTLSPTVETRYFSLFLTDSSIDNGDLPPPFSTANRDCHADDSEASAVTQSSTPRASVDR